MDGGVIVFIVLVLGGVIIITLDDKQKYTKFKIESTHNDRYYKVYVNGWFGWKSAFVHTDYFSIDYGSEEDALKAIRGYKNRFTEV